MTTTITPQPRFGPRHRLRSRPGARTLKVALGVAFAVVSSTACGTDGDEQLSSESFANPAAGDSSTTTEAASTSTSTSTSTAVVDQDENPAELPAAAIQYFEALSGDRSQASAHTVTDSPAARYATYFQTIGEAQLANADSAEPITMEVVGQTVELTTTGQTATYADIVVTDDQLESFAIDGNQIGDQLSTASPVQSGPLSVDRAVAYRTGGGLVITTMVITNTGDEAVTLDPAMAGYANSTGTVLEVYFAIGATEVEAGGTASLAWIWDDSDLTGTLTAEALPVSDPSMPVVLQVVFA